MVYADIMLGFKKCICDYLPRPKLKIIVIVCFRFKCLMFAEFVFIKTIALMLKLRNGDYRRLSQYDSQYSR